MKNIFGKMKKLACLGLAVLTVVSAAGCMVKKEWKISKADLAKVNKLAEETFDVDFMKDCESVYVDAFLSGTDEKYLSAPVYMVSDSDGKKYNCSPKLMLKNVVGENCPFYIGEITTDDCKNYSEKDKSFDVTVKLYVIDFSKYFTDQIESGLVAFTDSYSPDDPKSDDYKFYKYYNAFNKKNYPDVVRTLEIDEDICACGFLIDGIEKADTSILSDFMVPTEIVLKVKEVKGKFEIVPSKDKIVEDVEEQIKHKFID